MIEGKQCPKCKGYTEENFCPLCGEKTNEPF